MSCVPRARFNRDGKVFFLRGHALWVRQEALGIDCVAATRIVKLGSESILTSTVG
jgi:hypothetical protein